MGSFPFDIRLIIKAQLLENLKLLRTLHMFLTQTRQLQPNYSAFHQRCKALNVKPEAPNLQSLMEDYLVLKQQPSYQSHPIAQPLTLIPEIAEIDKISEKAVRDELDSPKKGFLVSKVKNTERSKATQPTANKLSQNPSSVKMTVSALNSKPLVRESEQLGDLKKTVVKTLEEKWGVIKQIEEIQKKDDTAMELLRKIEVG